MKEQASQKIYKDRLERCSKHKGKGLQTQKIRTVIKRTHWEGGKKDTATITDQ